MRPLLLLLVVPLLATACSKDPDAPATGAEADVTAKAVADVDAAMAEARRAPALPVATGAPAPLAAAPLAAAPAPPAASQRAAAAAAAIEAGGETAAAVDGQ